MRFDRECGARYAFDEGNTCEASHTVAASSRVSTIRSISVGAKTLILCISVTFNGDKFSCPKLSQDRENLEMSVDCGGGDFPMNKPVLYLCTYIPVSHTPSTVSMHEGVAEDAPPEQ